MKKTLRALSGIAAVLALSVSAAWAQDCHEQPTAPKQSTASSNKGADRKMAQSKKNSAGTSATNLAPGQVVTVDPKTHQVRPATPEEIGAMSNAPQPASATRNRMKLTGPKEIQHHTGAVGMVLDDSFMTSMVVTKAADGKMSYQCVEGAEGKTPNTDTNKDAGAQIKKGGADVK